MENAHVLHVLGCGVMQDLNAVKFHYRFGQVLRAPEVEAPRISTQSGTSDSGHSYDLQTLLNMLTI